MEVTRPEESALGFNFENVLHKWKQSGVNVDMLNCALKVPLRKMHPYGIDSTFSYRITKDELILKTASDLEIIQNNYSKAAQSLLNIFLENYEFSSKSDNVLGVNDSGVRLDFVNNEAPIIIIGKDGSHKLSCPIHGCKTQTFKLKRHLSDVHKDLTESQREYAILISKKLERNKKNKEITSNFVNKVSTVTKKLPKRNLVKRGTNHKKCIICGSLQKNMTAHIKKDHKIEATDPRYEQLVRSAIVVPKCYIKKLGGKYIELTGVELEEAEAANAGEVNNQRNELEKINELKEAILRLKTDINTAKDEHQYRDLCAELAGMQKQYKGIIYKDDHLYSPNVKLWKDAYLKVLTARKKKNPDRIIRMAVDVLLPFESESGDITIDSITDGRKIRDILTAFRKKNISNASKIKYIEQFSLFVLFLLKDIQSPIRIDNDQLEVMRRGFQYEEAKHEIKSEVDLLNKLKGKEMISKKMKAKKKLLSEKDLEKIMDQMHNQIVDVHDDMSKKLHFKYSIKKIASVRNCLMTVGAVRIARRSLELSQMTLQEVEDAETISINGEEYKQVNVMENKNANNGLTAPVVYSLLEFKVLQEYILSLRTKLNPNKFSRVVFPATPKVNSKPDEELSLSGVFSILNRIPTGAGKKLSTRVVRGSTITISRERNLSDTELNHIARSMGHHRKTADEYYDFSSTSVSVERALSNNKNGTKGISIFNIADTCTPSKKRPLVKSPNGNITACRKRLRYDNEESQDEGSEDEESQDEGSEDEESQDEGSEDEASRDEGSEDEASRDEGSEDEASRDEGSEDEASRDEGSEDEASQDEGSEDEASQDEGNKDKASQDEGNKGESIQPIEDEGDADAEIQNDASADRSVQKSPKVKRLRVQSNDYLLEQTINQILISIQRQNGIGSLWTKKGNLSICKIMKEIPKEISGKYSIWKIRSVTAKQMKNVI